MHSLYSVQFVLCQCLRRNDSSINRSTLPMQVLTLTGVLKAESVSHIGFTHISVRVYNKTKAIKKACQLVCGLVSPVSRCGHVCFLVPFLLAFLFTLWAVVFNVPLGAGIHCFPTFAVPKFPSMLIDSASNSFSNGLMNM